MEALERLNDPAKLDARNKLKDCLSREKDPGARSKLWDELYALTSHLEGNVIGLLRALRLHSSGFVLPLTVNSHRQPISADLWELAEVDFVTSSLSARGLRVTNIELYGSILDVEPDELMQSADVEAALPQQTRSPEFQSFDDYRKVRIRNHMFYFRGSMQVAVVRRLHEASMTAHPWVHWKVLLRTADSASNSLADLFKSHVDPSWRELIEGDKRGRYRLLLTSAPTADSQ